MNSKTIKRKPKKQRHYAVFVVSIIFTYVVYTYMKNTLNDVNDTYAKEVQRYIMQFKWSVGVMKGFNVVCTYKLIVIVLLMLVYNYGNIFKTFILLITLQIAVVVSAMMKLFFKEGRPFWYLLLNNNTRTSSSNSSISYININNYNNASLYNNNTYIYIYHNGYGTPDNDSLILCSFTLTMWYIIIKRQRCEYSFIIKLLTFIMFILIYIIHSFCNWILFGNSLSQILLSTCISCNIFIFMFYVLNIYSNNSTQYYNIMHFPIYYMGLIFFAIVLVFTIYFFSFKNFYGDDEETTFKRVIAHINHQTQPLMITSVFNEAYYSFCVVVMNIGIVCGNRREYSYLFESNKNNWMQYNFEKDDDTNDDDEESLMTKISFNKEIQWNHTSDIKSFFRFVILIPLLYLSILLYIYIDYTRSVIEIILFKIGLTVNIISFGMFHGYKQILKYLKLTNIIIFTMIRESV